MTNVIITYDRSYQLKEFPNGILLHIYWRKGDLVAVETEEMGPLKVPVAWVEELDLIDYSSILFEEKYGDMIDTDGLESVFEHIDFEAESRRNFEVFHLELTPEQINDELTKEYELHPLASREQWEEMVQGLKREFND